MKLIEERETLARLKQGASIARFGDGEFMLCLGDERIVHQSGDRDLAQRLKAVLEDDHPRLMVALPNIFQGLDHLDSDWTRPREWSRIAKRVRHLLNPERIWFSSFITRPELVKDLFNPSFFEAFQELWTERVVVYVGNSLHVTQPGWRIRHRTPEEILDHRLFANAKARRYLAAPRENAWSEYNRLLNHVLTFPKDVLLLLSLGPTATVMAAELNRAGYQAVDFGQLLMVHDFLVEGTRPKYVSAQAWRNRVNVGRGIHALPELQSLHIINQVVGPELKDSLVFDIGANVGKMTCVYRNAGARVVAVEPQSELTHENPAFDGCLVEHRCVADYEGQISFYQSSLDTISSCSSEWREGLYKEQSQWRKVQLPCTTLDRLIERYGLPVYIKIDVENFEDRVLAGLTRQVVLMSFEYTGGYGDCFHRCLDHIQRLGYTELVAFEVINTRGDKLNRIVELDHLQAARDYFDGLPRYRQGDLLVVNRSD